MSRGIIVAIGMAVSSFSLKNIGYILQKKGVDQIRVLREGERQRLSDYLANRIWLLGQVFPFLGMGLLIAAYAFSPISTLMPFMGIGLVVLALFCRFYLKETIHTVEWLAIALTVIGLILVNWPTAEVREIYPDISAIMTTFKKPVSLLFFILPCGIVLFLAVFSGRHSWKYAGSLFGVLAGIVGGTALIFQKPMSLGLKLLLRSGFDSSPILFILLCVFIFILLSLLAIVCVNIGYNHGRGILVAPLYAVFQMLFPTVGGVVLFHEWESLNTTEVLLKAVGIGIILSAMTILSLYNELKLEKQ
jgi:multidrug transporter EmrE-like cation transporter